MPSKAIKLDDETYARLQALAEVRQRSPHWLMKEAIRQFIEREEEAERVKRETVERWEHYEALGETVDHQVVEAWLETWGTEGEDKCPMP